MSFTVTGNAKRDQQMIRVIPREPEPLLTDDEVILAMVNLQIPIGFAVSALMHVPIQDLQSF